MAITATGSASALVAYQDDQSLMVRRTTDKGLDWSDPLQLASQGYAVALSSNGLTVDATYISGSQITYRRSTDGGASFGTPMPLSPTTSEIFYPAVSRGPNGLVAVTWREGDSYLRAAVSTNGGQTFSPAQTLTSNLYSSVSAVGVGKGIVYVAYSTPGKLVVRRTTDGGASWTKAKSLTTSYGGMISIAATADRAYIGWTVVNKKSAIVYRKTADRGATYGSTLTLAPAADGSPTGLHIVLQSGVLRAAFDRCYGINVCGSIAYYTESHDGVVWRPIEQISTNDEDTLDQDVTYAGRIIYVYSGGASGYDARVRTSAK